MGKLHLFCVSICILLTTVVAPPPNRQAAASQQQHDPSGAGAQGSANADQKPVR